MSRELRDALGHWATGVAIITGQDEHGQNFGMTVNSFSSVSLDPALVLWSVQDDCEYSQVFDRGYCVSILGADQQDIVWRFTQGAQSDRFDGVKTIACNSGRLALAGAIAHFDCAPYQRLRAGDHDILIGQIAEYSCNGRPPVLFNQGQLISLPG